MKTSGIAHIAHFVELCVQSGIYNVVLSPGSRNAPLIIAFESHPKIKTYLIHDERSAAFFAIGLSEALDQVVAISCTSGSAPLNYSPAIAEAYYRQIPLFVLTADRPPELIDQGDGQTIRQKNVYNNFVKAQFELPCVRDKKMLKESEEIVQKALSTLISGVSGPVHLNIPLSEPLYLLSEVELLELKIEKPDEVSPVLDDAQKNRIKEKWKSSHRRMILIGQQAADYVPSEALKILIDDPSVAVIVENTSNIQNFTQICHCIDRTLARISGDEIEDFIPDLLITIGEAVISKRIKKLFRDHPPQVHWRVGEYLFEENCFQILTESFQLSQSSFFNFLQEINSIGESSFGNKWKQKDFETAELHQSQLLELEFSDLLAFELVLSTLPENSNLHMGNSSVVRYCQLFDPVGSIKYFANRGVSGIDGCSSTALGMANGTDRLNTLISGDISFFYDSNVFWNSYLVDNLRIIVINNGGGGIFEFIDGPSESGHLSSFVAGHTGNVKKMCQAFSLDYFHADSREQLESCFHDFFGIKTDGGPKVLEINTTDCANSEILKNYFKGLSGK